MAFPMLLRALLDLFLDAYPKYYLFPHLQNRGCCSIPFKNRSENLG